MKPIGELKASAIAHCMVCRTPRKRTFKVTLFEGTEGEMNHAQAYIAMKHSSPYTCGVCKSILKSENR